MQELRAEALTALGYQEMDIRNTGAVSELAAACFDMSQAVYEQSTHYLFGYLAGAGKVTVATGFGNIVPIVFRDSIVDLPYPSVREPASFNALCSALQALSPVRICYLSEQQADKLSGNAITPFLRTVCSPREVHYSVDLLDRLPGKHFAGLRGLRNGTERKSSLTLREDGEVSLTDLLIIQSLWKKSRGSIYTADRTEKELGFFREIKDNPEGIRIIAAYVDDKPKGFVILCASARKSEGLLQVKAVNGPENESLRSLSGILYLQAARHAHSMGWSHLNDGDLGREEGSVAHKLSLRPEFETKTWDLRLLPV